MVSMSLLAVLAGCSHAPPPAAPATTGPPLTSAADPLTPPVLHKDDSGKAIALVVGAPLRVKLHLHSGTGFQWDQTQGDPNVLALQGPPATEDADPEKPGAVMAQVFSFVGKTKGTTHLEIVLHRPWDHGPPEQAFTLEVTVR
jgi:predicted secreted protein